MKAMWAMAAAGAAILAVAPAAGADRGGHRGGNFRSGGGGFHSGGPSMHGRGPSFEGRFRGHHHAFPRQFTVFSTVIAPPLFYSPPLVAATPAYPAVPYASPGPYVPPLTYDVSTFNVPAAPPLPPVPRVVEFPTGRYELRGDGIQAPYTWVWIPNPPTAPPTPPSPGAPAAADPAASTPRPAVYEWVDEQGVVHWTNRREAVPPRYRQSARPTS
jgi:hypothetical protein